MTEYQPRLFDCADAIVRVGTGLIDCTLPKEDWTHEAHLGACVWIVRDCPQFHAERDIPIFIARYNQSLGGVNDDTQGYHETITQLFISAVRDHLASRPEGDSLLVAVNSLLQSERGARDWPLRTYSQERLFSVEARRRFVAPDL